MEGQKDGRTEKMKNDKFEMRIWKSLKLEKMEVQKDIKMEGQKDIKMEGQKDNK